jgi:hypothetical protein
VRGSLQPRSSRSHLKKKKKKKEGEFRVERFTSLVGCWELRSSKEERKIQVREIKPHSRVTGPVGRTRLALRTPDANHNTRSCFSPFQENCKEFGDKENIICLARTNEGDQRRRLFLLSWAPPLPCPVGGRVWHGPAAALPIPISGLWAR